MIYNSAIQLSKLKKSVILKKTLLTKHYRPTQIDTSIELSERINLFIKQNTYDLSNSPNKNKFILEQNEMRQQ